MLIINKNIENKDMSRIDLMYEFIRSMSNTELDSLKGNNGYLTLYDNNDVSIDWWVGTNMFQEVDWIGASIIMNDDNGFEILDYCKDKYKISYEDYEKILFLIDFLSTVYIDR